MVATEQVWAPPKVTLNILSTSSLAQSYFNFNLLLSPIASHTFSLRLIMNCDQAQYIKKYTWYSLLCYGVLVQDVKPILWVICTWKKLKELSGMWVGNQGFIFKAIGEVRGWSSSLNVYLKNEIKAHIVHLLIQLNKFNLNPPEIKFYNFICI